jgi:hypothetical protein
MINSVCGFPSRCGFAAFADYAARAVPDWQSYLTMETNLLDRKWLICWIANGSTVCAVSYSQLRNISTTLIDPTTSEQDSFDQGKIRKAIFL